MSSLSFHDKQHVLRLLQQQGQVKRIFDDFTRRSGLLLTKWTEKNADNVWVRNATLEKQIDKLLTELHDNLLSNIQNNTTGAWEASNLKNDELLTAFIKDMALPELIGKSKFEELEKGMFARNMEALKAFQQRKIEGLTLSDTVWKSVDGAKQNLEYYLSSGISTGRPAASIAQDIRQLMQDPNKRFRRVRNHEGKLILSKPMENYNPGQGRYRSSYKNALRIAATETNQAYHTADYERWQKQDFVIGIEVFRSKSNKGPCKICDPMVGRYPKGYKFKGQHPWCICQAVPIMLEGEDFIDYLMTGEVPEEMMVKDVPQSAIDFVNEKEANQNQWFVKENKEFFDKGSSPAVSKEYVFDAEKLKEQGFIIHGRDNGQYSDIVKGFNMEEFNKDMTHISDKYGLGIDSKSLRLSSEDVEFTLSGANNFRIVRGFTDGIAYHDLLTIPKDLQGKGVSKEIFRTLYKQYQKAEVKEIRVHANIDIGGYTWGKYGFTARAKEYHSIVRHGNNALTKGKITQAEFDEFSSWIKKYEGVDIPMHEMAYKSYGKDLLLDSDWSGYINLTDIKQKDIFEKYLGINPK